MSEDETGGGSGGDSGGGGGRGPGRDVDGVAKGVEGVTDGIAAIIPGEDSEGEEALETVGDVAGAVSKGAEGLDKLASGAQSGNVANLGAGVGGIADAARYVVPEGEARDVLATHARERAGSYPWVGSPDGAAIAAMSDEEHSSPTGQAAGR